MTPDPVLVPMQNINATTIEVVTINNPSAEDRRIVSLEVTPPSAEWTLLDNVDGRDVPSGTSIDVRVRYTSPNEGRHLATLELTDVGACETSSSITLDGSSRIEPAFVLQIGVDRYSVLPFSQVSIPVEWETDVSDATPQTVDFALEYSRVLFVVDSVTSTYPHGTVNATIQPGRIDVEATSTSALFGSPGEILVMHGTANPAIPDSTTIDVVPGEVVSVEPTTIEDRDGLLHVQNCGPYNAIALGGPTRVIIAPPQPSSDAVNLAIQAAYDELLTIELYDMAGNLVGGSSGHLAPRGSSLMRVELDGLTSGQYLVRVLTNHGGEFNLRCLVVK